MKVWIVTDRDYDNRWTVAVYSTWALADEHVHLMGGDIEEVEVRDTIHPDAIDPVKQAERAAEAEKDRMQAEAYDQQWRYDQERRKEVRPNPPHMSLCHCKTFSKDDHFINAHGYCGFCGGFTPRVFRENMGEDALQTAIDKLAEHDRRKMREIVAAL